MAEAKSKKRSITEVVKPLNLESLKKQRTDLIARYKNAAGEPKSSGLVATAARPAVKPIPIGAGLTKPAAPGRMDENGKLVRVAAKVTAVAGKATAVTGKVAPGGVAAPKMTPDQLALHKEQQKSANDILKQKREEREIFHRGTNILVVGDGNLTFSGVLAEAVKNSYLEAGEEWNTENPPCQVYATTYHSIQELRELYPDEIDDTVACIASTGAKVMHDVDATNLLGSFGADGTIANGPIKFEKIYWNFPHAGCVKGFRDGHPFVGWRHVNLMRKFFRSARAVITDGGFISVSTNAKASGVNSTDMLQSSKAQEFVQIESFCFDDWAYAGYTRAFGDYRDATKARRVATDTTSEAYGQTARDDLVYCFQADIQTPDDCMAGLVLQPPPKPSLVLDGTMACGCGLICPTDQIMYFQDTHFKNHEPHKNVEGIQKLELVEQFMMSFAAFMD